MLPQKEDIIQTDRLSGMQVSDTMLDYVSWIDRFLRQPIEHAIFTNDKEKKYKDYDLTNWHHDEEHGTYMDEASEKDFEKFSRLWKVICPYCDVTDFDGLESLKKHTRAVHRLEFWYDISSLISCDHI